MALVVLPRRQQERSHDLEAFDGQTVAFSGHAEVADLRQRPDGRLGVAQSGESAAVGADEPDDDRAALGERDAGHGHALPDGDVETAVRAPTDVGGHDLVVRLEVGLDGAHVARRAVGRGADDLAEEGLGQESVGLVTERDPARGRGVLQRDPEKIAHQGEQHRAENGGQPGPDGATAADLVGRHAVDLLRDEVAPVTVRGAEIRITTSSEDPVEEAHVSARPSGGIC